MQKSVFHILLVLALVSCGGTATDSSESSGSQKGISTGGTSLQSGNESDVTMSFTVDMTIYPGNTDDFDESMEISLPDTYELPLTLSDDGTLTFYANEFPTMVYRICNPDSTSQNCDIKPEIEDIPDMDLVFDSCDRLILSHSECGSSDGTLYEGTIDDDGNLTFADIAIRTRVFFVTTSGSSGYTATPTQTGSINDLSRILLDLSTATSLDDGELVVLGTGTIPDKQIGDLPSLGLSNFEASIDGTFDTDPFEIIN